MRILSSLILGISLIVGLYLAGNHIGQGGSRFRADNRSLTVKGLAEQQVKADTAVWRIQFRRAGNDLPAVQAEIANDSKLTQAFLQQQGFTAQDINLPPVRVVDKLANEYGGSGQEAMRYIVSGTVVIATKNVDLVQKAEQNLGQLQSQGVMLDVKDEGSSANPNYSLSNFNEELRPQLLQAATKNARDTAAQFAANLGVKVGKVRNANQGVIQILGADGQDESGYGSTSSVEKKLRVVSTFEFELK